MFEGVAHEALSECVSSLHFASNAIKSKKVRIIMFLKTVQAINICLKCLNMTIVLNNLGGEG